MLRIHSLLNNEMKWDVILPIIQRHEPAHWKDWVTVCKYLGHLKGSHQFAPFYFWFVEQVIMRVEQTDMTAPTRQLRDVATIMNILHLTMRASTESFGNVRVGMRPEQAESHKLAQTDIKNAAEYMLATYLPNFKMGTQASRPEVARHLASIANYMQQMEMRGRRNQMIMLSLQKIVEENNLIKASDYISLFLLVKSYGEKKYTMVEEAGEDRLHHKIALRANNNVFLENLVVQLMSVTDNFRRPYLKQNQNSKLVRTVLEKVSENQCEFLLTSKDIQCLDWIHIYLKEVY